MHNISMIVTPMFIGYTEIILLVILALVFFGGKKIPELMRGMGRGVKEFKDAVNKDYSEEDPAGQTAEASNAATAQTAENIPLTDPRNDSAKRRGRPRKSDKATIEAAPAAQPKRRGRPRKQVNQQAEN